MTTHSSERSAAHYFKVHVYEHLSRHLWKTALWTFGALTVVGRSRICIWRSLPPGAGSPFSFWGPRRAHPLVGPHLIFVTLFAQGLVPFSLLASSIVQDGHGMLPMLSFSPGIRQS